MRRRTGDVFRTASAVGKQSDETARQKQAGFFAKQLRPSRLQAVDGRVFSINIIADFCITHGIPRGEGGAGDGIASKVDQNWCCFKDGQKKGR